MEGKAKIKLGIYTITPDTCLPSLPGGNPSLPGGNPSLPGGNPGKLLGVDFYRVNRWK